ncbi:MAG: glycosyltransferase [Flavobacteriales bacterium]
MASVLFMEDPHPQLRVLIVAYYQHDDPLVRSILFEHFKGMLGSGDMRLHVLTFENESPGEKEKMKFREEWGKEGVEWHRLVSGPHILKGGRKLFDLWKGIRKGRRIAAQEGADLVYSEGFPSAIIGYHISKRENLPHAVHTYEPHAAYMVEAGVWSRKSWEYRIMRYYERKVGESSDLLFTGSERMRQALKRSSVPGTVRRIPSSVDLSFFHFTQKGREEVRGRSGIPSRALVFTYMGKLGGMYYDVELFEFFKVARSVYADLDLYFMLLTPEGRERVHSYAKRAGVPLDRILVISVDREEVPSYLSAADFALSGMRQSPSKVYASPIKHGEYWACGLPIFIFRGVSEDDERVEEEASGVVIERPEKKAYEQALQKADELLRLDKEERMTRCRRSAEKERSLKQAQHAIKESLWSLKEGKGKASSGDQEARNSSERS